MATPGVILVKSFTYRDNPEEWSNGYHFTGDPPADEAAWIDLVNALTAIEKACLTDYNTYERAYVYSNYDGHHAADFVIEYGTGGATPATGSLVGDGHIIAPGDAAAWVRWKTSRTNSHGRPIYLRKYFHSVVLGGEGTDNYDIISTYQSIPLQTYADAVVAGSGAWPGLAGPDGVAPGANKVSPYVTTRTLERRGKRPH